MRNGTDIKLKQLFRIVLMSQGNSMQLERLKRSCNGQKDTPENRKALGGC
jgi:hypothetical protein